MAFFVIISANVSAENVLKKHHRKWGSMGKESFLSTKAHTYKISEQ